MPALHDVSLDLAHGDRLLLLGPNGAGKSTFIRVLAGLMRATAGEALVHERPARSARHLIGVVSHATFLYDELTAMENLRLFGELYDVARLSPRATELLEQVGIVQLAEERVGRLSRGQQQRLSIARALLHDPPVLLLDEPDTGLDQAAFALVETLLRGRERTIVLTTHNLPAGIRLGNRCAVLSRGELVHAQNTLAPADLDRLGDLIQQLAAA